MQLRMEHECRSLSRLLVVLALVSMVCLPAAADQGERDPAAAVGTDGISVLDLQTAQRMALAESPSLAAAAARVKQAKERLVQARSAYLPQLDISASAAHVSLSETDFQSSLTAARAFDPTAAIEDSGDYYSARLTANWVLFNGFERHFTRAASRYGADLSQFAYQDAHRLLLSAVSAAYYAAQLAMENIGIAEADEAFNKRQLAEARTRRRVGTGSLSDELNFEVRVNAARAQVIQARQVYDRGMFALAALLGVSEGALPRDLKLASLDPETPGEMTRPEVESLVEYAQQHRPDIRRFHLAEKQADANVGIARAKFFPTLNIGASYDGDRAGDGDFQGDDFGGTLALSLSYPLFAGGFYRARLREAEAQADEAGNVLAQLVLTVSSQVRGAATKVSSAQDQLKIQRENAALVQKNRDLVEKEYVAGKGSLVRLNQAQRDLTTAQGRLALALVSLRQAWYDLRTETAQIIEKEAP